jgi:hypothetical protein
VADAVRGAGDACDAGADDGDSTAVEAGFGCGRVRREDLVQEPWMSSKMNNMG